MHATVMHNTGDVRIENVPDSVIQKPTDGWISKAKRWRRPSQSSIVTARSRSSSVVRNWRKNVCTGCSG